MKRKKKKRITIYLLIVSAFYLSGYAVCRLKSEMIHRKSWNGGWNRHWVVASTPEPSIPLPFARFHISNDGEFNAATAKFKAEYKSISARRKAYGIVFFPVRCVESMIWWIVNPKDDQDE